MTMPVFCPHCRTLVGVFDSSIFAKAGLNDFLLAEKAIGNLQAGIVDCSRHQESKRTETKKLLGLVKEVHIFYPETETVSSWVEYLGSPNKFMLFTAIILSGCDGIVVNGKWAWWDFKIGLFGKGVDELVNL